MGGLQKAIEICIGEAEGNWAVAAEEINNGSTFILQGDRQYYAASLIKVPIMVAAFKLAEKGDLRLRDQLTLEAEDQVGGCGVLQHMSPGIKLPVHDLVTLMIIQSDNTATNMLIDLVGMERIQSVMREIGMTQSEIHHKLMIVAVDRKATNCVTALDVTAVLRLMAKGECVSLHASQQMIHIMKQQQLSNGFTSLLPALQETVVGSINDWEAASKTGNVEGITHETAILYAGKRAVAITILVEGVAERQAQETIAQIGKSIYSYMTT
ncbi:serine hydrolase [Sporosarcina sp. NCCP-2222]|uniref:serine hydrolase n=1 Tax=Sporosarcina sp. NCCP-2222 TaxID=2935073 RepID=UPI0020884105|nr:serine hydrolase [Sporosarcina sp. NCCP-2222]GKV56400.1 serine hydrolase [Sporosarcina sp. NCCP-2222]